MRSSKVSYRASKAWTRASCSAVTSNSPNSSISTTLLAAKLFRTSVKIQPRSSRLSKKINNLLRGFKRPCIHTWRHLDSQPRSSSLFTRRRWSKFSWKKSPTTRLTSPNPSCIPSDLQPKVKHRAFTSAYSLPMSYKCWSN